GLAGELECVAILHPLQPEIIFPYGDRRDHNRPVCEVFLRNALRGVERFRQPINVDAVYKKNAAFRCISSRHLPGEDNLRPALEGGYLCPLDDTLCRRLRSSAFAASGR